MPAYRFCRTDDIPFLVAALNACYRVHFPDQVPLSVADFKREMRELNVWASSCMAATEDGEPIAVVTGAKREHETLIHRIGVHPDFQRRGHAQHLLESLSHKLSVLGPPKVVAEVSDDQSEVSDLFEAVGYKAEGSLTDFVLSEPHARPSPSAAGRVAPIGLDDLRSRGALDANVSRSWERALETLQNRKDQLEGLAITSETRVEAYVLFRDLPEYGRREIVSFGRNHQQADAGGLLEQVVRVASQAGPLRVTIPRVSWEEVAEADLESIGFRSEGTYSCYADLPGSRMH